MGNIALQKVDEQPLGNRKRCQPLVALHEDTLKLWQESRQRFCRCPVSLIRDTQSSLV